MKKYLQILLTGLALAIMGSAFSASVGEAASDGAVVAMAATADLSALQSYSGKFSKKLLAQMLDGLDVARDITVMRNVRAPRDLPKLTVNAGLRPLNVNVEDAKNPGRAWSSRRITPREAMKVFHVVPDELRDSFMSEMLAPGAKREPFAAWAWMREMEKLGSEVNEVAYDGVYNADAADWDSGTAYSENDFVNFNHDIYECTDAGGTSAGQSPTTHPALWTLRNAESVVDGLGTVIASIISGSEIPSDNIINSGAISNSNAVDVIENQWNEIPERYRRGGLTAYISWNVYYKYLEQFKTKYGYSDFVNKANGNGIVPVFNAGNRLQLKPCTWMKDSQRVIMTRKDNLIMGTDVLGDFNQIKKTIETLHGYKAVAKFILSFQVADTEMLFINDQA